uniref:Odorant binding protein n=1 Tax=Semiothisa cinerearia TaxID=2249628 RepID=A0A889XL36_9NEOP|nr:odorant binding protein [Semiothisa cinerearia]
MIEIKRPVKCIKVFHHILKPLNHFFNAYNSTPRQAQLTEAQKAKIYGNLLTGGMECMKDFPLSLDHITAFRNKKVPDDEVVNCFSHCLYKKLGLMDNSGKLSEKKALKEAKKNLS